MSAIGCEGCGAATAGYDTAGTKKIGSSFMAQSSAV